MDSIKRLAWYLGYRGNISLRNNLLGQSTSLLRRDLSTRNCVRAKKGLVVEDRIAIVKELLKDYDSKFWDAFKQKLKEEIENEEGTDITEIIPEDPWVRDPFADSTHFFSELCNHHHLSIEGGITFGIEGESFWPFPDPDLVFTWKLEFKAIDSFSTISISLTINFEGIEGPGLGLIFAAIGFLLGGGIIFASGAIVGATGLVVGEIIDLQYENSDNQGKALQSINSGYDALGDFLNDFVESRSVQVARPTEKSVQIILKIDHVPSAAEGLLGIACEVREIIECFS